MSDCAIDLQQFKLLQWCFHSPHPPSMRQTFCSWRAPECRCMKRRQREERPGNKVKGVCFHYVKVQSKLSVPYTKSSSLFGGGHG
jgi:hypothetical protein